jgi:hypothetical protein
MRDRSARFGAILAMFTLTGIASSAWADKTPAATVTSVPTPIPSPESPPGPAATVSAKSGVSATASADVNINVNTTSWDETDVTEKDGHRYYFLGARYRGYVIPKAFMNIFVSGGATVLSNSGGIEFDIRKEGFSIIPNLTYTEYSTGDMLFLQHNEPDTVAGNWSLVNSGLKVIYAGSDFLWSAKISKNVDFEYGFGFSVGVVFGNLEDNWVTNQGITANSTYTNSSGQSVPALSGGSVVSGNTSYFVPCQTQGPTGCNTGDHSGATIAKVGGYNEPHGFNPVPTIIPNLSIPQIGLRIKPIKSFVARVSVGFNIPNGVWFGFSGNYGFEDLLDKK